MGRKRTKQIVCKAMITMIIIVRRQYNTRGVVLICLVYNGLVANVMFGITMFAILPVGS